MGISGAVEWWEEWQLRILVLASLFVQWILFISSTVRKLAIPSWFRSLIWLAYLGSDALAIYALATLFSRQRKQDYGSANSNSILEVVWAPVLLVHLGGQDSITAYNIEDNELWTRQALTAVSQITVAIYVFCKSWPGGDKKLLQASILFFVMGVLKCIAKPWSLKLASFSSLVSFADPYLHNPRMPSSAESNTARYLRMARMPGVVIEADPCSKVVSGNGKGISLEDYVQKARAFVLANCNSQVRGEGVTIGLEHNHVPQAQGEASEVDLEGSHHRQAQRKGGEADLEPSHVRQAQREDDAADLETNHHDQVHEQAYANDLKPSHVSSVIWWIRIFLHRLAATLLPNERERWQMKRMAGKEGRKLDLEARKIFVDLASSYPDRLTTLEIFLPHEPYSSLQEVLSNMFDLLYTKAKTVSIASGTITRAEVTLMGVISFFVRGTVIYLPLAAIVLFHKSHREAYNVDDVKVTYALFCCTAVLEVFSMSVLTTALRGLIRPSGMVAQYSLIGFLIRNKRHNKKMCILSSFNCKDFLDQRWCMESCSSSSIITQLVLIHVKGWWEEHIVDAASYRRFSDHRGQWTIQHKGCDQDKEWGLNRQLDESVLIWHIATDLCIYQKPDLSFSNKSATRCREISNYMIYLLFVKPEMLLPGSRRNLFKAANAELEEILKDDKPLLEKILNGDKASLMEILNCNKPFLQFLKGKSPSPKEIKIEFMQIIITNMKTREEVASRAELPLDAEKNPAAEGFVNDAWKISKALLALDDDKMWEVIEGVWVEMLCFSASRCRGFLHAKSMGSGMELLTYVWFLLSHMGMETLPERLQRTELSSGGGNAGAPPSTSQTSGSEEDPQPHEAAAACASTSRPQEITAPE